LAERILTHQALIEHTWECVIAFDLRSETG
jgi:hypothetical protein